MTANGDLYRVKKKFTANNIKITMNNIFLKAN
ncbi:MAG: hypothetical protein ACJAQX_002376 [Polaribacter sp.]|jgi:hypothetical protein